MAAISDIISLDDFERKLPSWDPDGSNHLYAIVDMGSNGIRFSISDLSPPKARLLTCIYRERAGISLFDALNSSADSGVGPLTFPDETIRDVARTLARFRRIADDYGVPQAHISVLATEAMRRAANAGAMLDAIRQAAHIGVHVLAPEVETLFGAVMGSRSAFVDVSHGGLFLDLGGGSVQLTWVDTRLEAYEIAAASAGESMPFGAARLIRVLENDSPEVQATEKRKLQNGMLEAFSKLCEKFPSLKVLNDAHEQATGHGGIDVYLCGGGFRGYGSMLMHDDATKPYPISSIGTYTVPGHIFKQTSSMRLINEQYEGKIFGMSKRRRRQFPAIATVVEAFLAAVPNIRTATFCSGSNRDGSLFMKLPTSIREANPLEVLAGISDAERPVADEVLMVLRGALPTNLDLTNSPNIFSLGLGYLLVKGIWARRGEDDDSNASFALHHAVTRDPSAPGLTHLARAILGLTTSARWGSALGPVDMQLHRSLRSLVQNADEQAVFWAEYIGGVAAILGIVVPVWPKHAGDVSKVLRLEAIVDNEKNKPKLRLQVHVAPQVLIGADIEDLEDRMSDAGKHKGDKKPHFKVSVSVMEMA